MGACRTLAGSLMGACRKLDRRVTGAEQIAAFQDLISPPLLLEAA
ncbi:MAG: hypothetical protein ACLPSL_02270 [Smithella sp.]